MAPIRNGAPTWPYHQSNHRIYSQPDPRKSDSSSHENSHLPNCRQLYYRNKCSSYSNTRNYDDSQNGNFESLTFRGAASPQVYSTDSDLLRNTGQINSIIVNKTNVSTGLAGFKAQKQVLKAVHITESVEY